MNSSIPPLLYDVTLRDGSHANRHSFSTSFCDTYIAKAYSAGIRYIEIGHGNGLGGSSLHIGKQSDSSLLSNVHRYLQSYPDLKIGVHVIPGLSTFYDLDYAIDMGVSIFRVASHCSEADTTQSYISHINNQGLEVWGLLMMAHMIKPDQLSREAKKMEGYGAKRIVILDSAGAFTPKNVTNIMNELFSTLFVPFGFHAHNNLHCAVANSIASISAGATSIDATTHGYGAGAGNLCLEAFVAILEKDDYNLSLNISKLLQLSSFLGLQFESTLPVVDTLSIATAYHGLFSGFKPKILDAAYRYDVNVFDLISLLGSQQLIAGQEDQIYLSAQSLSNPNE